MSLLHVIIYGIVQGLTEFLPISPTAHLRIVQQWLDPHEKSSAFLAFTAVIQLGTTLALVMFFWRELFQIAIAWIRGIFDRSVRSSLEYRMGWYLIIATIPVAVVGVLFNKQINNGSQNLWVLSITLIAGALLLLIADLVGRKYREEEDLTIADAFAVSVAQAAALVPGASRSATTIAAGLFRGLDRVTAARFSFVLAIPAIVLSSIYEGRNIGEKGAPGAGLTGVAVVFAFVFGLAALAWLMRWISRHGLLVFVVYRILLGGAVIALLATHHVSAT
jgi:undecaprenyl-diphosphatase